MMNDECSNFLTEKICSLTFAEGEHITHAKREYHLCEAQISLDQRSNITAKLCFACYALLNSPFFTSMTFTPFVRSISSQVVIMT